MTTNPWMLIAAGLALALAVLGLLLYSRRSAGRRRRHDDLKFQAQAVLSPRQLQCLQYLHRAFPEEPVLVRVPLERLVTARKPAERAAAAEAVQGLRADFVVCNDAGKAVYAFDVDGLTRTTDATVAQEEQRVKNDVLRSAGVRFVRLKGAVDHWPAPADFRLKLSLAALRSVSTVGGTPSGNSQFQPSAYQDSRFAESEVMGMTRIMALDDADADAAWRAARD